MNQFESLINKAEKIGIQINSKIREGKTILIIGHLDADGITSASIIGQAIKRKKGHPIIRICGEIDIQVLEEIKNDEYDFHIFCELGAGLVKDIRTILNDKWIIIDHHQIPPEEMKMNLVFNSWQFKYDGGKEICAAGMAYYISKAMDEENIDLAWLPVVAMVADRQDQGDRRSVFGLNRKILDDAVNTGLVKVMTDLLLYGRETRPVYEALSSTTTPFIPGLSGNREACLATLNSAGITLKQNGRWRTLADLSSTDKKKVIDAVIPYFSQIAGASEAIDSLIGEVYTLDKEDEHSSLRDAREFGTLLNACGRMKKTGVGVSICLGDRGKALQEAEKTLLEYRRTLNMLIRTLLEEEERIIEKSAFNMVIGDGIVDEDILGSLTSILSGVDRFETKTFLARTTSAGSYKISLRRPPKADSSINLGAIVHELSQIHGGTGGGHEAAAGSKIPTSKLKSYLSDLNKRLRPRDENSG
jgi:RecJ-like exonuclease